MNLDIFGIVWKVLECTIFWNLSPDFERKHEENVGWF